jgi:Amt family ammonium transporter
MAGLAGGTLSAQLGSWFAKGRLEPQAAPRGALAGLFAVSAGAPFVPLWSALVIGAVAGLLLPLTTCGLRHLLHFEDVTSAISAYVLPAAWGLLAVALFADGRWGQGWNITSGAAGQGISGLLTGTGLQVNSGQLAAQLCGCAALWALGFLLPWGIFRLVSAGYGLQLSLRTRVSRMRYSPVHTTDPSGESRITSGHLDQIVKADDS